MDDGLKKYASELGRKGALARWKKTTPKERKDYAHKLVAARKAKRETLQNQPQE